MLFLHRSGVVRPPESLKRLCNPLDILPTGVANWTFVLVLHLLTFHHTLLHIVGPHANFGGIPMPRSAFSRETLICGHARSEPLTFSERRLNNGVFSWYVFCKFIGSCQTTLGHKLCHYSMLFLRRSGVALRLIRGPRIIYPLDILRMGVALWNFLLVCVWLVHIIMSKHFGAQVVP